MTPKSSHKGRSRTFNTAFAGRTLPFNVAPSFSEYRVDGCLTYAIRCLVTDRIKVGRTSGDMGKRLSAIQGCSPTALELWASLVVSEDEAHAALKEHHLHGEWFNACTAVYEYLFEVTALPPDYLEALEARATEKRITYIQQLLDRHVRPRHVA